MYLNLANSEQAEAGTKRKITKAEIAKIKSLVDLSHLSYEEMELLLNRDFVRDTLQKEYPSVKWNTNNVLSHLTLEVGNNKYEFSLELFDRNGSRVLYFANLTEEKVFVDKLELIPNYEYNYLITNSIGEMYAGNLKFN